MNATMTAVASLAMISLDCDKPAALADFYHRILGWEIAHSEGDYAMITEGPVSVGFGRIDGYTPPRWRALADPAGHPFWLCVTQQG